MQKASSQSYPVIGTARLLHPEFDKFLTQERACVSGKMQTWFEKNWEYYFSRQQANDITNAAEYLYKQSLWGRSTFSYQINEKHVDAIIELDRYLTKHNLAWECRHQDDHVVMIASGNIVVALPPHVVSVNLYQNMDSLTRAERMALIADSKADDSDGFSMIPVSDDSMDQVRDHIVETKQEIEKKQDALAEKKKEMQAEIERQKALIEAQYAKELESIRNKTQELDAQLQKLNQQVFLLDTQIYGIRCFLGETVNFIPIVTGEPADTEEPVVLFQKLRYLDEEMAKIACVYDFDGGDLGLFEDLLVAREDIRELFAPGPKSVSLVRISKDSIAYGAHPRIANMLTKYETYHGSRIGILIRNGEDLYIGWTDETRISMQDNLFYKPETKQVDPEDSLPKSESKEAIASRYYVFQILQGILRNKKLLSLPDGVSVYKPSPYVILSMADGWLPDNRFGDFSDILEHTSGKLQKGDYILTTLFITRGDYYEPTNEKAYHNDRGRGEKNRTHDASIPDRRVLPINCIDKVDTYEVKYDKCEAEQEEDGSWRRTDKIIGSGKWTFRVTNDVYGGMPYENMKGLTPEQIFAKIEAEQHYFDDARLVVNHNGKMYQEILTSVTKVSTAYSYFVSALKQESIWSSDTKGSRANMQVYSDEYINLTYLNSIYLRYAIANRKAEKFVIGGRYVNYKTAVPYMQTALSWLLEREEKEKAMLAPHFKALPDEWQLLISEWRLKHGYHALTETRAKRFAKEYLQRKES